MEEDWIKVLGQIALVMVEARHLEKGDEGEGSARSMYFLHTLQFILRYVIEYGLLSSFLHEHTEGCRT